MGSLICKHLHELCCVCLWCTSVNIPHELLLCVFVVHMCCGECVCGVVSVCGVLCVQMPA